jgi:hypothetical protein
MLRVGTNLNVSYRIHPTVCKTSIVLSCMPDRGSTSNTNDFLQVVMRYGHLASVLSCPLGPQYMLVYTNTVSVVAAGDEQMLDLERYCTSAWYDAQITRSQPGLAGVTAFLVAL